MDMQQATDALGRQFPAAPPLQESGRAGFKAARPTDMRDAQLRAWTEKWAPSAEASKGTARAALDRAREARLAGDPNRAEYERRQAAVARGHAQDVQGIHPSPRVFQRPTTFMAHDMKATRRLP